MKEPQVLPEAPPTADSGTKTNVASDGSDHGRQRRSKLPLPVEQPDESITGSRPRSRRYRRWTVLLVAPAFVIVALSLRPSGPVESDFFIEASSTFTVGAGPTPVGDPHFFHVVTPRPLGKRPIRFLSAEILGVPEGLVIDRVWAVRFSETGPSYVGAANGPKAAERLRPDFHDASEVVLDPSCPPTAGCGERYGPDPEGTPVQDWYLLVEMHSTRLGRFETKGFRLLAERDGRKVSQKSFRQTFVVNSTERRVTT